MSATSLSSQTSLTADAPTLESEWGKFASRVRDCKALDLMLTQKTGGMSGAEVTSRATDAVRDLSDAYLSYLATQPVEDLSDGKMLSFKRYTDGLPFKDFENALELVPALVNLVSLADALPLDGSELPFDLRKIAVKCKNAVYFAPRRFTAVQLAFDEPRSRVLLFRARSVCFLNTQRHPRGRLCSSRFVPRVCTQTLDGWSAPVRHQPPPLLRSTPALTRHARSPASAGCAGPVAAKLAVVRALKAISEDAGVRIGVRRFSVINQVFLLLALPTPRKPPKTCLSTCCRSALSPWEPSSTVTRSPTRIRRTATTTKTRLWVWP